jgi:hypothetical protein
MYQGHRRIKKNHIDHLFPSLFSPCMYRELRFQKISPPSTLPRAPHPLGAARRPSCADELPPIAASTHGRPHRAGQPPPTLAASPSRPSPGCLLRCRRRPVPPSRPTATEAGPRQPMLPIGPGPLPRPHAASALSRLLDCHQVFFSILL